jgi:crotonobetainyl-CoA:carnitine CoA-transferase CaiB-like acyl-CoA transferase
MNLKGRLILDCSALLPGPFIGKLLSLHGAQVIKIENPKKPDRAKTMGTFYDDLNSLKKVIQLDITDPDDRKEFESWVQKADGLIEGFRPQTKKKLGLEFDTLHQINPKLCVVSLVGYPEDGPWKDRAGHDLNFQAVTGCLSLFTEMPSLPLADLFAAYEGAFSLTAALDSVARGGNGTRVVVSMAEVLKTIQSNLIREYQTTGTLPLPGTHLFSGGFPCYRIYTTADGRRVTVGAIEHKFWKKVCEILNLAHLESQGYATGDLGTQVSTEVQTAFQKKTWAHWAPLFESADCCVEPVLDYSEVYSRGIQS